MTDSVKKILIIRCGALGDLVYATSVIDALKLQFGDETIIDFVCTPGTGTLFKNDKRVHKVFPLKHKKVPIFLSNQKQEIINNSQMNPYDILINFEYGKQFKSLVKSIQAEKKVGAIVEEIQIPDSIIHMVEITKYMFKGVVDESIYRNSFPKLIGSNTKKMQEKYELLVPYVIISPSNSHQKRNILNYRAWQNESWTQLIARLVSDTLVVIVGNKGEDDFFNQLKPYPANVMDLVGKTSLVDLVGVIEGATALVATDTGTAHMASAVNTPVFALIGPTPAQQTGPYKTPHNEVHILSANLECSPCYKTKVMQECKDNICMQQISIEQVYQSIKSANLL